MFRRTDKTAANPGTQPTTPVKPGGKGYATPTRKQAEAARKERAKAAFDTKSARKLDRQKRMAKQEKIRAGMRAGDERYLPARDQGPVKKFVRNWVDARLSFAEVLLPLLLIVMFFIYSDNRQMVELGNRLWTTTILLTVIDTVWMVFRLKRAVRAEFPEVESTRGVNSYAMLRVLQPRFMRMPKAAVKIGGRPKTPKTPKAPKVKK